MKKKIEDALAAKQSAFYFLCTLQLSLYELYRVYFFNRTIRRKPKLYEILSLKSLSFFCDNNFDIVNFSDKRELFIKMKEINLYSLVPIDSVSRKNHPFSYKNNFMVSEDKNRKSRRFPVTFNKCYSFCKIFFNKISSHYFS